MRPETRYAQSGDVNIAYQVIGDGPRDLVVVPGWVSNIDLFWEEPHVTRFLKRLASFSRLILFDKRGTGLSDRVSDMPSLEIRMDDVRAVMDAASSERAALFGYSERGPMCALFAATYPTRTTALIMAAATRGACGRLTSPGERRRIHGNVSLTTWSGIGAGRSDSTSGRRAWPQIRVFGNGGPATCGSPPVPARAERSGV